MKSITQLIALGLCCFACVSCSFLGNVHTPSYSPSIVDDETRMLQTGDSYFYKTRSVDLTEEQADCSFTKFSGLETFYVLESEENELITISVHASVDTNRFKVVLVNQAIQEVVTMSQGSGQTNRTVSLEAGRSSLKFVGYDASGSVHLTLQTPEGVSIRIPATW